MKFEEALKLAGNWLDEIAGVEGVAEGSIDGERCITVFVSTPETKEKLPSRLEGYKVVSEVSGHFTAQ